MYMHTNPPPPPSFLPSLPPSIHISLFLFLFPFRSFPLSVFPPALIRTGLGAQGHRVAHGVVRPEDHAIGTRAWLKFNGGRARGPEGRSWIAPGAKAPRPRGTGRSPRLMIVMPGFTKKKRRLVRSWPVRTVAEHNVPPITTGGPRHVRLSTRTPNHTHQPTHPAHTRAAGANHPPNDPKSCRCPPSG